MVDKALDKQSKASKQRKTREWKKQLAGFRQKDKLWNQFRRCLLQTSRHGSPDRNWPRVWRNKNKANNKAHGKSRDSHFLTNRPRAKHTPAQMTMTYRDQQQTCASYASCACLCSKTWYQRLLKVQTLVEEYFFAMKKIWNARRACALVNKLLYAALCHRHRKRLFACIQFLQKAHFLLPDLDGHRKNFFQWVDK